MDTLIIAVPLVASLLGVVGVIVYNVLRGIRVTKEAIFVYCAIVLGAFLIGFLITLFLLIGLGGGTSTPA